MIYGLREHDEAVDCGARGVGGEGEVGVGVAVGGDGGYGGKKGESWEEEGGEDGHFGGVGDDRVAKIVISNNSGRMLKVEM